MSDAIERLRALASAPQQPPTPASVSDAAVESLGSQLARKHAIYLTRATVREMLEEAFAPAPEPSVDEQFFPRVPDEVMAYIQAYGDARADDDGTSGQRIGDAIKALRRWAAQPQAAQAVPDEIAETMRRALVHFSDCEYEMLKASKRLVVKQTAQQNMNDADAALNWLAAAPSAPAQPQDVENLAVNRYRTAPGDSQGDTE